MFFHNVFYFWHNTSKPSKITYKNINLMFFQAKAIWKAEATAVPNEHYAKSERGERLTRNDLGWS